ARYDHTSSGWHFSYYIDSTGAYLNSAYTVDSNGNVTPTASFNAGDPAASADLTKTGGVRALTGRVVNNEVQLLFVSGFGTSFEPNPNDSVYALTDTGANSSFTTLASYGSASVLAGIAFTPTQTVTSSAQVGSAPTITSAASTTFTVGAAGTFTVTTTGSPTPTLSETGALPASVTFVDNGNGTATLSGTPAAGTQGTYPITITASNGVAPDAVQNFSLVVNPAPAAPSITSAATTTITVGAAGTFEVTTTGNPTAAITESGALPSGVTFVDNGNGTATLSGTPAAGTEGSYPITITASNGVAPDATQSFSLVVNPAPAAPAITSANSTDFAEGSSNTFTVTATGVPTPTLTETGALPTDVTFVDNANGTATLSGTPPVGTAGVYTITITAHNGVSPDATQTFTLTVSAAVIQSSPFGYLAGVPGDGTEQTFVHNLYRELLGREPDAVGDTFWTGFLAAHNTPAGRQDAIAGFMDSPEYKAHYITTLYEVFLGRAPEASGLQYWTDKMGEPGTPGLHGGSADESFILSAIVGSDEFYARAGGTPEGFVNALYQDLLGRPGEAAGVAGWVALVNAQPSNRDGIVRLFLTSPEAEHRLLDSFYPAPGGTASHPLPAPGTGVAAGAYDLAIVTGDGWENLYLEGPFDSSPQGNDAFFAELANGTGWDDVQLSLLNTSQYYTNPNRPVTS
ncbi:MAG: DUF4214 domain-containing protein, partial [Pirellulales bacterium]